jgi:hypothetical protein
LLGSTKGAQRASSDTMRAGRTATQGSIATGSARRLILGMVLASMVLITSAGPAFASDPLDAQPSEAGIGTALRPGDPLTDNGVTLLVPAPGQTVWAAAEFVDGTVQELQVATTSNGQISVVDWGDDRVATAHLEAAESVALTDARAGRTECRDTGRRLYGWRTPTYRWSYSARTTPRKFTQRKHGVAQVVSALIRANRSVTSARNVCGRGDRVSAGFRYLGRTHRVPWRGSSCGGGDRHSVIGWGPLPRYVLAFMCVHSMTGRRSREADIMLNTRQPYEATRRRCGGEFLIEAPMAHEFGHVYGLGHVRGSSLTMHPHISWCSTAETTLGKGDLLGLERKY